MIKIDSKYFSPVYTTQPCFPLLPSIKTLDRDLHKIPFKFSLQVRFAHPSMFSISSTLCSGFSYSCCCSVTCLTLLPHGLQHTRLPCPSSSPGVCSNSCPLSRWCHPIISSSVAPFSSYLQSFPASGCFKMSQFFESGGQSIGASASVLPVDSGLIFFRIAWFDLLAIQGTLKNLL